MSSTDGRLADKEEKEMTEKKLRKYLGKTYYHNEDLPILRDVARKLKHDLDVSHLEIHRLRKAIENWRKYHDRNPNYEPCAGCRKLEEVLD